MKTSSSFLLTFCSLIAARGVEANCRFVPIPARGEYKRNGLTSYVEVFGIRLYMSFDLDEEYLQYAANVLAGYIDNDEDGQVDDEGMLAAVDQTYCRHFYISTYEFDKGADGNGGLKAIDSDFRDSFCSISRYQSSNSGAFQYSVREELHHGLAKYWDHAYPSVTGAYGSNWNEGDSELINALHDAHGNCERAADCGPTQDCTDYSCSYSENSCEWIEGSCTGVYHYAEIDCGGSCWTHEGLWHGYATIAGIYDNSYQRSNMSSEWGVFSEDAMKSNADASMLYRLLTNRAPSRSVLGYHFPTRNPRGDGVGYVGNPTGEFAGLCFPGDDGSSVIDDDNFNDNEGDDDDDDDDNEGGGGPGGDGPDNGEAMCENRGYNRRECTAVGCCDFNGGNCWSAVGKGRCEGGSGGNSGDNSDENSGESSDGTDSNGGDGPDNGEAMCENHGYNRRECRAVGCCDFNGGNCWSAVGDGKCSGRSRRLRHGRISF